MNHKRKQQETVIKLDQNWLFEQVAQITIPDLDTSNTGDISLDEFRAHFVDECGLEMKIADAVFADIDQNADGRLSVLEFTRWKSKHTQPQTLQHFFSGKVSALPLSPMISVG